MTFDEALGFVVEAARGKPRMDRVDATEERFVQIDRVRLASQQGRHLTLYRFEFVRAIRAREMRKHALDAIERHAHPLEGEDRVLECRRL